MPQRCQGRVLISLIFISNSSSHNYISMEIINRNKANNIVLKHANRATIATSLKATSQFIIPLTILLKTTLNHLKLIRNNLNQALQTANIREAQVSKSIFVEAMELNPLMTKNQPQIITILMSLVPARVIYVKVIVQLIERIDPSTQVLYQENWKMLRKS